MTLDESQFLVREAIKLGQLSPSQLQPGKGASKGEAAWGKFSVSWDLRDGVMGVFFVVNLIAE